MPYVFSVVNLTIHYHLVFLKQFTVSSQQLKELRCFLIHLRYSIFKVLNHYLYVVLTPFKLSVYNVRQLLNYIKPRFPCQ